MKEIMYMASRKGRTFKTHSTIEECKKEAEADAMENSRKRSEYSINKVRNEGNGLISYIFDLNERSIRGKQHGTVCIIFIRGKLLKFRRFS